MPMYRWKNLAMHYLFQIREILRRSDFGRTPLDEICLNSHDFQIICMRYHKTIWTLAHNISGVKTPIIWLIRYP